MVAGHGLGVGVAVGFGAAVGVGVGVGATVGVGVAVGATVGVAVALAAGTAVAVKAASTVGVGSVVGADESDWFDELPGCTLVTPDVGVPVAEASVVDVGSGVPVTVCTLLLLL